MDFTVINTSKNYVQFNANINNSKMTYRKISCICDKARHGDRSEVYVCL